MSAAATPIQLYLPQPPPEAVAELLGDAYRQASVTGVDMRQAVELLEPVRVAAASHDDPLETWRILDAAAGRAATSPLRPIVADTRARYADAIADAALSSVEAVEGPQSRCAAWLSAYAAGLSRFRMRLLERLAAAQLPPCDDPAGLVSSVKAGTAHVLAQQWDRALPTLLSLVEHAPNHGGVRARLLAILAEIHLFWLDDPEAAEERLAAAAESEPTEPRVWVVHGELEFNRKNLMAARSAYVRALDLRQDSGDAYRGLGDCSRADDDFDGAERDYLRGIAQCPDSECYLGLIELYARPELFSAHEQDLAELYTKAITIDPDVGFQAAITLGNTYRDNDRPSLAARHYDHAITLRPMRIAAYEAKGYLHLRTGELEAGDRLFGTVIGLDPDTWEGYWGRACVCEKREDREGVLRWRREALGHTQRSRGLLQASVARALLDLGRWQEAGAEVSAGLAANPQLDVLGEALREVATHAWPIDPAAARTLISLASPGDDAASVARREALIGDIALDAGDARSAVEEYGRAVAADPEDPAYRRSLARALLDLKEWVEARQALEAAFSLDHDRVSRDRELARVSNDEGNSHFEAERYEEATEAYRQAIAAFSEEAVYHSNLALALEWGARAGRRGSAMQLAISALQRAADLAPNPDYTTRLDGLRRRERAVSRFGELILTPAIVAPVIVRVGSELAKWVDPERQGTQFLKVEIPLLRTRVREATGAAIPGVRLREDPSLLPGGFVVEVDHVVTARGDVPAGAEGGNVLLQSLEENLLHNSWRLIGIDEADNIVTRAFASEAASSRQPSPRERLLLGRVLRALLREGVGLTDVWRVISAIGPARITSEELPATFARTYAALTANLRKRVSAPAAAPLEATAASNSSPNGWSRPLSPGEELAQSVAARRHVEGTGATVFTTSAADRTAYLQRALEPDVAAASPHPPVVLAKAQPRGGAVL